jgi:hypothetical protein
MLRSFISEPRGIRVDFDEGVVKSLTTTTVSHPSSSFFAESNFDSSVRRTTRSSTVTGRGVADRVVDADAKLYEIRFDRFFLDSTTQLI